MAKFYFDAELRHNSIFQKQKITEDDLPLIRQLDIKDWNDKPFNEDILVKYSEWVVNKDKSLIFQSLGGGSFEIPYMYEFIYKTVKVRIEKQYGVNSIYIPRTLSEEVASVAALAAEAYAVYFGYQVVEFN